MLGLLQWISMLSNELDFPLYGFSALYSLPVSQSHDHYSCNYGIRFPTLPYASIQLCLHPLTFPVQLFHQILHHILPVNLKTNMVYRKCNNLCIVLINYCWKILQYQYLHSVHLQLLSCHHQADCPGTDLL